MKWLLPIAILSVAHGAVTRQPGEIVAAGASFPSAAYKDMFRSWALIQQQTYVTYEATGSGTGKSRIVKDIVDFAGSDSKLKAAQYEQVPDLQMLPALASAVVVVTNIPELEAANTPVVLSGETLAGIYSGQILTWDDERIKKDNPDLPLPNKAVQVLTRADKSGTTSILSGFLEKAGKDWKYGTFSTFTDELTSLDNFEAVKYKNQGISAAAFNTPYSISYMSYNLAMDWPAWRVASIINNQGEAKRPDNKLVENAMSLAEYDSRFNADIFGLDGDVYPLAALTYIVIRKNASDTSEEGCENRKNTMRMLQWMYTSDLAKSEASKNGFVTLPEDVRNDVISILAGLKCKDKFSLSKIVGKVNKDTADETELICPQLPPTTPKQLAQGRSWRAPPLGWSCEPELYYELDGLFAETAACNCGCGVIDPDCGFVLKSCDDQTWEPKYTALTCEGANSEMDILYCRLESATCQPLPPGLARGRTSPWTCIPDVYNELSDPGTSLNDCDCNCNGEDPDCFSNFNNMYCAGVNEENELGNQVPKALIWGSGYTCIVNSAGAGCVHEDDGKTDVELKEADQEDDGQGAVLDCPQLPQVAPEQLADGHHHNEVPAAWTCDPAKYYELETGSSTFSCDCGCGVIDPDCGFNLKTCTDQTWNPMYTTLNCNGEPHDPDLAYCRLESATCNLLPPGLSRGKTSDWKCIPDVYNEMADPGTSLNDCDCNCGGYDPDCNAEYANIYCDETGGGPIPRAVNITCGSVRTGDKVTCMEKGSLLEPLQSCVFGMSLDLSKGKCTVQGWVIGVGVAALFVFGLIFSCCIAQASSRGDIVYNKIKKPSGALLA